MEALGKSAPIGLGLQNVRQNVRDGLAREDRQPRQHFVEHDAERPDVGPLIRRLTARLFRAHVTGCPQNETLLGHRDGQCR